MEDKTQVRIKVLARLITAKTHNKFVPRRDLLKIASRGYLDRLLPDLQREGFIIRKGPRGAYQYQGTELATKLLDLGTLPRSPLMPQTASERPRGHLVQLRPITQFLDIDSLWMEHQRVSVNLDSHTADVLRAKCNPESPRDRARQKSYSCSAFTATIARRGSCVLILKEPQWEEAFAKWLLGSGLSQSGTNSVLSMLRAQLPDSRKQVEMPVLDPTLKGREVAFAVTTKIGDDKIVTNINYSTKVDMEIFGTAFLVDQWLAVLGGTQHNMVVVQAAMRQEISELSQKVNEMQKEREAAEKKDEKKKEADYYG